MKNTMTTATDDAKTTIIIITKDNTNKNSDKTKGIVLNQPITKPLIQQKIQIIMTKILTTMLLLWPPKIQLLHIRIVAWSFDHAPISFVLFFCLLVGKSS